MTENVARPPCFSWHFRFIQRISGFAFYSGFFPRRRRCGGSNRACAISFRGGNRSVLPAENAEISSGKIRYALGKTERKTDSVSFFFYGRAAVGDEFRDSDGAGTGQFFRRRDHGGFCCGGQNRYTGLYARAGFGKRLLHVYGAKLRRAEIPAHPAGNGGVCALDDSVLPCRRSRGVHFLPVP